MCEVTSGRNMAGRHFRNRRITFVEDRTGARGSKGVSVFSNLGSKSGAETEGTVVMSEC
jgi:hypothetical protein